MTKEQEVIKRLNFHKEYARLSSNRVVISETDLETVLNMLKEKDAKIEHLEEKRNNQKAELAILNEKQKEMNKLTNTVSSYKGMFKKEQKDNKKKDKIIYEMMGSFLDIGFGFEYCNNDNRCINDCEECLMKYFERKATNNG